MRILGVIGGLGPESTVDYYRSIISVYRERVSGESYPSIIINSLDFTKGLRLVEASDWAGLTEYLVEATKRLADAGAAFGIISANTPHVVFEEVQKASPLLMISIVDAACQEAKRLGLKRVGLLGTRFTMSRQFYPRVFTREGVVIVPPTEQEQAYIHDKYLNELVNGIFLPETRSRLLGIIEEQKRRDGIEAVILGGTELPLILRAQEASGLPLLDTTQIHVRAAVAEMLE